jgi:hypothetical protein
LGRWGAKPIRCHAGGQVIRPQETQAQHASRRARVASEHLMNARLNLVMTGRSTSIGVVIDARVDPHFAGHSRAGQIESMERSPALMSDPKNTGT